MDYLANILTLPNKVKPKDVQSGNVDWKTKGHFMIAMTHNYRALSIIGTVPWLQIIETPLLCTHPTNVKQDIGKINDVMIILDVMINTSLHVTSIKNKASNIRTIFIVLQLSELSNHARPHIPAPLLSTYIHQISYSCQSRRFITRPPLDHWVWPLLCSKMKLLPTLLIVSGLVCDKK